MLWIYVMDSIFSSIMVPSKRRSRESISWKVTRILVMHRLGRHARISIPAAGDLIGYNCRTSFYWYELPQSYPLPSTQCLYRRFLLPRWARALSAPKGLACGLVKLHDQPG